MDNTINFQELLSIADCNKSEAKDEASIKRYSTVLPPPKKIKKSGVQSDGIKRFLEKRKAEEAARAAEARKQKEQLLQLRAQNSKSNKKAKIMASRTKDNDFSRIKLTEDEIQSKKKIEIELVRKRLNDKVARMKCRIEMEEKEKLLPKKRKRKSKNGTSEVIDESYIQEQIQEKSRDANNSFKDRSNFKDKNSFKDRNSERKVPRSAPPAMSFHELLKVAETKQFEPIVIPVKKKEGKLLTKKERRLLEEEQERLQRRKERIKNKEPAMSKTNPSKHSSGNDKKNSTVEKTDVTKPTVIRVAKDPASRVREESQKFKIPKSSSSIERNASISKIADKNRMPIDKLSKVSSSSALKLSANHNEVKYSKALPSSQASKLSDRGKDTRNGAFSEKHQTPKPHTNHDRQKPSKNIAQVQKPQVKPIIKHEDKSLSKKSQSAEKLVSKKNGIKVAPVAAVPVEVPKIDTEALMAEMEKRLRERLAKEMEEKFAAELANRLKSAPPSAPKPVPSKPPDKIKHPNGAHLAMNGKTPGKPPMVRPVPSKRPMPPPTKPPNSSQRTGPPPPKPFHPNPYLDPPRRRLEPLRPTKPMKRRIESDDEDDDDDDMNDFIDDGPSQNDEDYSKYIQEIFGYDRNKYVDDDDDDIVETSFVEQMKEETRSAKLGYLEDLEEERKLREMEKKRKMKMKK